MSQQNQSWGRTVPVPLTLEFSKMGNTKEELFPYEKEYSSLSNMDTDPLGQYMKIAKSRGETKESDELTLKLLVALHYKIDELKRIMTNETREYLELQCKENVQALGHGVVIMPKVLFEVGAIYYARIDLPVFPQRIVPLFLEAVTREVAKVKKMHERDERDWDGYITSRERAIIRELKGN
ncbi:hypothetical protein CCZ01_04195 [Helicobacter monodelphidis]|uniref:hypothetical protein n=1 Tax=Helicobacter sp. 15-1451 TaxID=2004995 RepID=UPI000DCEDFF5|nr:hypothetical protein [Helicobacter sp. 15-1451]RAX58018.1 hypothetical protein CCZ01_04195 [Helicobacter sp. 15-1451]